jgi:hypothetical protein
MRPPPNQRQTSGQFCCYRGGIEASAVKEAGGQVGLHPKGNQIQRLLGAVVASSNLPFKY